MAIILRSLVWECSRRLALPYVATLASLLFIPWFLGRVLFNIPADALDSRTFYGVYFCLGIFLFCSSAYAAQAGVRQRLFLLPLSTQFISAWLLIAPATIVAGGHCISTVVINHLYGTSWPWLRPLLYFALVALLGNVLYWRLLVGSVTQLPVCIAVAATVLLTMLTRFIPDGFRGALHLDLPITSWELGCVLGVGMIACWVGHRSLSDLRVNARDSLTPATLVDRLDAAVRQARTWSSLTWSTPAEAIRSLSWRDGAVQGMLGGALIAILTGILIVTTFANGAELLQLTTALMLVIPISNGTLLGITVAMSLRRPGTPEQQLISSFIATKPVSTNFVWEQLGHVLFVANMISWLTLCLACSLVCAICAALAPERVWAEYPQWSLVETWGMWGILGWLALSFGMGWAVARLAAAMMCFGRDNLLRFITIGIAIPSLSIALLIQTLPAETRTQCSSVALLILGLVVGGATIASFTIAQPRSLVDSRQLMTGSVIWLVTGGLLFGLTDWSLLRQLASVSSCGAIVASIAVGRLALWTNRHR